MAGPSHVASPAAAEPCTEQPVDSPPAADAETRQGPSVDAWFATDGDDGGADSWLSSGHVAPDAEAHSPVAEAAASQDEASDERHPEGDDGSGRDAWLASEDTLPLDDAAAGDAQPADDAWRPPTASAPAIKGRHSSSMSFARTVSHDINFNDDDDADWSLTRSPTDTLNSFMPSLDRTNSFPAVPPASADPELDNNRPLPPTQALHLLEETEREAQIDEYGYLADTGADGAQDALIRPSPPEPRGHVASQSIGGDLHEPDAAEARFEEGIPLISQTDGDVTTSPKAILADAFAEGDGSEDAFFSQRGGDTAHDAQPIERKSTMEVLGLADDGHSPRQDSPGSLAEEPRVDEANAPPVEDLMSKWQDAFAGDDGDDDFLLEDTAADNEDIDAAAFLGSDDEGFLDDDIDDAAPKPSPAVMGASAPQPQTTSPYAPSAYTPTTQPAVAAYVPAAAAPAQSFPYQQAAPASFGTAPSSFGQPIPPPRPELPKAQSFADKSKGGYASPYDLPTDLVSVTVKPRKRPSLQPIPKEQSFAPPRSASLNSPNRPPSSGPPSSTASRAPPLGQKASAPSLRGQTSFFEDLPVTTKPRPGSRQSNRTQSPSPYTPIGQQPPSIPPPSARSAPPPAIAPSMPPQAAAAGNLVAPERASPYATIQSAPSVAPPPGGASRYSPAAAPPRYSPAPAASRTSHPYSPSGPVTPSQAAHPHLPRTSSPLAHFDSSVDRAHGAAHGPNGDAHHYDRRSSSSFEPRLNRVSSLPPTREVAEEDEEDASPANRSFSAAYAAPSPSSQPESKYGSAADATARSTPPLPHSNYAPSTASPPKRASSNYTPQAASAPRPGIAPPARASTQSPGAMHSSRPYRPIEADVRPSSSHNLPLASAPHKPSHAPHVPPTRVRGQSLTMNEVAPTDGRENDPLGRWRGAPLLAWGVGGTVVTMFPQSVPRYSMGQSAPTILRTAGEVKTRNVKDMEPLQDRLARFPGPLRGKSKKKEALAWLAAGIEAQERDLPDISLHAQLSLHEKRGVERVLLWRLLRIFVEFDGTLEGSPAVETAVREVLSPESVTPTADNDALFPTAASLGAQATPATSMQADGADAAAMDQIRRDLLRGDGVTAVWSAVDKRLWGHAMLISQTISPDLYKQVAQEFVRKEVNFPGHNNESLGALYKVLSGNCDDCVDELVPSHARAGLQLVTTESTSGPAPDAINGLDKWRETLTLILSNRSANDARGLNALGKLLSGYGRAEAAQVCFIFSRSLSVFGGLDDPSADFVLLGSDHRQQSDQFAKETEALLLSEVYEYGISLGTGVAAAAGAPHLAAYKLQHAITLAEYGYRDKALQYCDAIAAAMGSQTKRSPYYHAVVEAAVEDLMTRLKQAPKEISSSWISKPSMNKVSDSMWNRFNKFVAGDDADGTGHAAGEVENGPFARIASSPNMSRSPSATNLDFYGAVSPSYGVNPAPHVPAAHSAATSRYAPVATQPAGAVNPYAPAAPSSARNSNEHARNPYEPSRPATSSSSTVAANNGYAPSGYAPSGAGYLPAQPELAQPGTSYQPGASQRSASGNYQPFGLQESPSIYPEPASNGVATSSHDQGYQPPTSGYEAPSLVPAAAIESNEQSAEGGGGGYEPPSYQPYGYEPPSHQPHSEAGQDDDAPKPKKKGIMYDDDDDDDYAPAAKPQAKTKTERDRENEEMFRKAAEEDGKEPFECMREAGDGD